MTAATAPPLNPKGPEISSAIRSALAEDETQRPDFYMAYALVPVPAGIQLRLWSIVPAGAIPSPHARNFETLEEARDFVPEHFHRITRRQILGRSLSLEVWA